jgi:hypothetical protein
LVVREIPDSPLEPETTRSYPKKSLKDIPPAWIKSREVEADSPPVLKGPGPGVKETQMQVAEPVGDLRCPKHPENPQIVGGPDSKRAGQYLGFCRQCLAELRQQKGKGKKAAISGATAEGEVITAVAPEAGALAPPLEKATVLCPVHHLPIKYNVKGVSMGGCIKCRQEIAAMGGYRAKIKAAIDPMEKVFESYPDELAWIREVAGCQVRTPEQQLVYLVRQAMSGMAGQRTDKTWVD